MRTTPKRLISAPSGISLHTTVISAFSSQYGNQYLIVIQLVYTVTTCNNYIWLMTFFQETDILVHRICCATVPPAVVSGYGRSEGIKTSPAFCQNSTILMSLNAHSVSVHCTGSVLRQSVYVSCSYYSMQNQCIGSFRRLALLQLHACWKVPAYDDCFHLLKLILMPSYSVTFLNNSSTAC